MNLSRLAALAVFFIMVMSTFVTVPTYNVGADERGCMDYDDTNGNGLYDEGEPCYDDDDGEGRPPGEGRGCMDYDDTNDNGLYDEGEPCYDDHGIGWEVGYVNMEMESLDSWLVDFYGTMSIEESDEAREGIAHMCAEMMGTDEGEITEECFSHWLDTMMSGDDHGEHGDDDCPFDADNPDSPCNAEVCHDDNDSPECNDYTANYCETSDDPVCIVWDECGPSGNTVMGCYTGFYDYCTSADPSEELCEEAMGQDENGTWFMCSDTSYDGETWDEECEPNWFVGLIAYERGDITASQFMDYYLSSRSEHMEHYDPVLFELSHITLTHEAEWTITPDYLGFEQPDFVCGNHADHEDGNGTIPFYWVNDGYDDCGDGSDEQWYDNNTPDDHSDNCQKSYYNDSEECEGEEVNWFDCHDDSKIWIWQVNNGDWDCQDGEDEDRSSYWGANLYLYEGHLSRDELNDGNVIAQQNSYCDWADEDMIEIECDSIIIGDLVGEYTLATVAHCDENWEYYYDEDNDDWRYELNETSPYSCNDWGEFSHELMSDHGESHTEYINGSVSQDSFIIFNHPTCDDYIIESCEEQEFVLYHYYGITVPTGGIDDTLISGAWECYYEGGGSPYYCHSASVALYVYDGYADLNGSDEDWYHGVIIESNQGFDDNYDTEGYNCMAPEEFNNTCRYSRLHLELDEGHYTIVTATTYTWHHGIEYGSYWLNDSYPFYSHSAILENSYWVNEDSGGRDISGVSVDDNGNITTDFTQAFETDGDGDDIWIRYEALRDDGAWDYLDSTGLDNGDTHESFTCWRDYWCDDWDGESTLRITLFAYGNYTVVHWNPSTPDLLEFVDPEWRQGANRGHFPVAEEECSYCDDDYYYDEEEYYNSMWMENITMYFGGEITAEEAAENIAIVTALMEEAGMFDMDYVDMEGWSEYDYCEWEGDDFAGDTRWYCADEYEEYEESGNFDNWWYYCEVYTDDDDSERWVCTDNFGQDPDFAFYYADNTHYKDGTSPHDDHDHDEHDHDEHHEDDDNPALLDGIVGVNDPEDPEPMPMAENMVGVLSDNEGLPMMMGTTFKIHFEGVDASLETHEAYIPVGDDGSGTVWHVEMTLLEGYEVISCDGCEGLEEDGINYKFSTTEPVTITFGEIKEVDTSECAVIVTVGEGGYSFEPAEITMQEESKNAPTGFFETIFFSLLTIKIFF